MTYSHNKINCWQKILSSCNLTFHIFILNTRIQQMVSELMEIAFCHNGIFCFFATLV